MGLPRRIETTTAWVGETAVSGVTDNLLAQVYAPVLPQVGKPLFGVVCHQVGELGEPTAVRTIRPPREPFRLIVTPDMGNESQKDLFSSSSFKPLALASHYLGCQKVAAGASSLLLVLSGMPCTTLYLSS